MRPKHGRNFPASAITVDLLWRTLEKQLFDGVQPSEIQRTEMRRAFYIGFTEGFAVLTDLSEELSEDEACKVLDRLEKECREFHAAEINKLLPSRGNA